MKTNSTSRSAFFNPRALIGFVLCSIGLLLAVVGMLATTSAAQSPSRIGTATVLHNIFLWSWDWAEQCWYR